MTARAIPPHLLGRIGDPFLRAAAAPVRDRRRPEYEGMGLGLFIAKTLLERTGAELSFANGTDPSPSSRCPASSRGAIVEVVWPRDAKTAIEARERDPGAGRERADFGDLSSPQAALKRFVNHSHGIGLTADRCIGKPRDDQYALCPRARRCRPSSSRSRCCSSSACSTDAGRSSLRRFIGRGTRPRSCSSSRTRPCWTPPRRPAAARLRPRAAAAPGRISQPALRRGSRRLATSDRRPRRGRRDASSTSADGTSRLRAEWHDGVARITLDDAAGRDQRARRSTAQPAGDDSTSLKILRTSAETRPSRSGAKTATGAITWCNAAYLRLADSVAGSDDVPPWPPARVFTDTNRRTRPRRQTRHRRLLIDPAPAGHAPLVRL